jgi:hypothetical protein
VEKTEIVVAFCEKFHEKFPSGRFNVRFSIPRMNWRNMHRAIDKAELALLWPKEAPSVSLETPIKIEDAKLRDKVENFL